MRSFRKSGEEILHRWGKRLGVAIGIFMGLLVALFFLLPWTSAVGDRLELIALDTLFRLRSPIVETDEIIHIDIDDNSIESLGDYPWRRSRHAELIDALSYLGAGLIVFDVEFKKPSIYHPHEETGLFRTAGTDDETLANAIERAGNVVLAFSFDLSNPFPDRVEALLPELKRIVSQNAAMSEAEICRSLGVDPSIFEGNFIKVRDFTIEEIVRERIAANAALSFKNLCESLIPGYDKMRHKAIWNVIQKRYVQVLSTRIIRERTSANVKGADRSPVDVHSLMAPMMDFCRAAAGLGCVNAVKDDDGILRHIPLYLVYDGKPYLPLSIETYIKREELRRRTVGVEIRPGAVVLRSRGADEADVETRLIPVNDRGMALVNWAGRPPETRPFQHLPYARLIQFYEQRFLQRLKNVRDIVEKSNVPEKPAMLKRIASLESADIRRAMNELSSIEEWCRGILDGEIAKPDSSYPGVSPRIIASIKQGCRNSLKILVEMRDDLTLEDDLRGLVAGRICFVGSASTASGDLHPIPLSSANPGVDIHSSVLNMILTDQFLLPASGTAKFAAMMVCSILISITASSQTPAKSVVFTGILFVVYAAVLLIGFGVFAVQLNAAGPFTAGVVSLLSVTVYREFTERRAKRRMQKELEGKMSKSLVTEIIRDPERIKRPQKTIATAFFSDIKGFTPVSEKMAPEQLVHFLNRYHNEMSQIMLRHDGYLDKYLGDGIMGVFCVPIPRPDHAARACAAALDCIGALENLNRAYEADNLPRVEARVGINSGEMIAGTVGSAERHDYTVIGDSVNLAARLEVANKFYGTRICIGESTAEMVKDEFDLRELDIIRVTGKRVAVRIYELLCRKGQLPADRADLVAAYRDGLSRFREREWDRAFAAFEKARKMDGEDTPTKVYIKRCADFSMSPPGEEWDGVFDVLTK